MRGRTTFVIAHRLSTIRNVDCIYVLKEGRIIESGPHDELLARGGHYTSLVARAGDLGRATIEAISRFREAGFEARPPDCPVIRELRSPLAQGTAHAAGPFGRLIQY